MEIIYLYLDFVKFTVENIEFDTPVAPNILKFSNSQIKCQFLNLNFNQSDLNEIEKSVVWVYFKRLTAMWLMAAVVDGGRLGGCYNMYSKALLIESL